jgi:hypothetical protein
VQGFKNEMPWCVAPLTRTFLKEGRNVAYLELTINGLTVRLERFLNETQPRIDATGNESNLTYTASGAAVVGGSSFESLSIWNVEAPISATDAQTLKLIYTECDYQRRMQGNFNILVTDTTQLHEERSPRTRALAPNTSVISRSPYVLYYARYYAVMLKKPEFRIMGKGYAVQFTLQETDKVAP